MEKQHAPHHGPQMNERNAREKETADQYALRFAVLVSFALSVGLSRADTAKRMNDVGFRTRTGGAWTQKSIIRLAARLKRLGVLNVDPIVEAAGASTGEETSETRSFARSAGNGTPPFRAERSIHDDSEDGPGEAAIYLDDANEVELERQRRVALTWAERHDVRVVREFRDIIKPNRPLNSLVDAAFFAVATGRDVVVAKSWLLHVNARYIKIAAPARRAGVRFFSADIRRFALMELDVYREFGNAVIEAGVNWTRDPGGGRRDASILTEEEEWAAQFAAELLLGTKNGWSDNELADHLASIGKTRPAGYPITAEDVLAMREIFAKLHRDIFGAKR